MTFIVTLRVATAVFVFCNWAFGDVRSDEMHKVESITGESLWSRLGGRLAAVIADQLASKRLVGEDAAAMGKAPN